MLWKLPPAIIRMFHCDSVSSLHFRLNYLLACSLFSIHFVLHIKRNTNPKHNRNQRTTEIPWQQQRNRPVLQIERSVQIVRFSGIWVRASILNSTSFGEIFKVAQQSDWKLYIFVWTFFQYYNSWTFLSHTTHWASHLACELIALKCYACLCEYPYLIIKPI